MAGARTNNGNFRVQAPAKGLEFTGERMTTAVEGQIEFEHLHRYCLARDLCVGLDVLDVASGEGYGSAILAGVARSAVGVDIDARAVAHAREAYRIDNLRFLEGSATDLPLEDASVDVVVSFETLEHIGEHERFAAEVKRVLRPGGTFIVSTPDRAVYSALGEPVNEYHVRELTEAEFDSFLRASFRHVAMLRQRAILGSLVTKTDDGGPWRSYERRSVEYIEASGGLARAPYLIGVASDGELSHLPSSVYMDRRQVGEVVGGYLQVAALNAQIGRLNGERTCMDLERTRLDAERVRLSGERDLLSRERSRLAEELDGHAAELANLRSRLAEELDGHAAELANLQQKYDKIRRSFAYRFARETGRLPRSVGRLLRRAWFRAAYHSNGRPRGWLRRLRSHSRAASGDSSDLSSSARPPLAGLIGSGGTFDERKATILVVAHEASRTGAPILALNLVQQLSARYNVVSLILGGGELVDDFRRASAALYGADRIHMAEKQLDRVVKDITARYQLKFAIVNSVESRMALKVLNADGVPTVSLIHEFSAYTRPRSAIPDVVTLSTETVFSTRVTLENAVSELWLFPAASIHVEPQGKCTVPASPAADQDYSAEQRWLMNNLRPEGGTPRFLVIGAGAIQMRKGIDLFIECASIIKDQGDGERFHFVWIGDGFDPENELAYSVYLADQIKRSAVGSLVNFLRSTSQIELAYRAADLFIVSSRLDPLPNVAIDAMTSGLPVLCFEKTTGVADFLTENGLGDECVARYLDAHDLARKVKALADSDELRASVADRCRAAAQSAFDMKRYASKIEAIAMQAVGNEAIVKKDVDTISASGKFRSDFFRDSTVESLPEEKLIESYVRRAASGLRIRKPMPGFHPTVYCWHGKSREGWRSSDPFADFLRSKLPQGPWLQRVIENDGVTKHAPRAARMALHIHAYYPDRLTDIAERLGLNASTPDLFVSVTSAEAAEQTKKALSGCHIADLRITPNLGRDIGPLLTEFGRTLCDSYDIIGHVHTKKSVDLANPAFAAAWSEFLLENLLGGKRGGAMLDLILSSMEADPTIGIVFPDDPHVLSWTANREHADRIAARMGIGSLPDEFNFPIGDMFWARPAVLSKFVELDLRWGDYPPEPAPGDGTVIHAIERLFGVVPQTMGLTCAVTNVRGVTR